MNKIDYHFLPSIVYTAKTHIHAKFQLNIEAFTQVMTIFFEKINKIFLISKLLIKELSNVFQTIWFVEIHLRFKFQNDTKSVT